MFLDTFANYKLLIAQNMETFKKKIMINKAISHTTKIRSSKTMFVYVCMFS